MKAAFAYLRRAMVVGEFMDSLVDLLAYEQALPAAERVFDLRVIRHKSPPYPNLGRRKLVRKFLAECPDAEVLVIVDDDAQFEPWQPGALASLVSEARPVVQALYFSYDEAQGGVRPIVLKRKPDGSLGTIWHYEPNTMKPVDSIGTHFVAIHRTALEDWRRLRGETWFDYGTRPNGDFALEDEAFAVRMLELGHPLYVHTGIHVQHWKLGPKGQQDYVVPNGPESEIERFFATASKEEIDAQLQKANFDYYNKIGTDILPPREAPDNIPR